MAAWAQTMIRLRWAVRAAWNWWLPDSVAKVVRVDPSPLEAQQAPALRPAAR